MIPQLLAVTLLIEQGNAHAVLVRRNMLGLYIHGDFAQIEIGADACRGGNTGGLQYLANQLHGEFPGGKTVGAQIGSGINKHLVDGVHMDVLRRHILKIDLIDLCADGHIMGHTGRGNDIVQRQ